MNKKMINKNKRKDKVNLFVRGGNLLPSLPQNLPMPTMAGLSMSPSLGKMDLQNMKLNPINTMMRNPFQDKLGAAVGKFGTGVTSAVDILGSSLDNAKIADTSAQEASIDSQKNMVVGASSNDELMAEWGNFNKVKDNYTKRDVRGGSTGQRVSNTLSSTGQGVMGGMTVGGPIGGIVGGALGLGSAIGGWFGGNRKARRKARKLNKAAKEANDRALTTLENKAEDIDTQNDFNMLANFSAKGGFLNNRNIFAKGGNMDKQEPKVKKIKLINEKNPNEAQLTQRTESQALYAKQREQDEAFNNFLYKNQHLTNVDPTKISTNPKEARFNYENNKNLAYNTAMVGSTFGSAVANPIGTIGGILGGVAGQEGAGYIADLMNVKGLGKDVMQFSGSLLGGGVGYSKGSKSSVSKKINKKRDKDFFINDVAHQIEKGDVPISTPKTKQINMKEVPNNSPTFNNNEGSIYRTDLRGKQSKLNSYEKSGITKYNRNQPIKTNPVKGESNLGDDIYLINRAKTPYDFSNGDMVWKSNPIRKTSHFTVDQSVQGHNGGNWDGAADTMITPYKQMVAKNGLPLNNDPMDTWFGNPNNMVVDRKGSKILTGDINNYKKYKYQGIDATFSKESSKLLKEIKTVDSKIKNIYDPSELNLIGEPKSKEAFSKLRELESKKSSLEQKNRAVVEQWLKDNKVPLSDDQLLNFGKDGNSYEEISIALNRKYPDRYSPAPATHWNTWTSEAERNVQFDRGFNPEKSIIPHYNTYGEKWITKQDLPVVQRYLMEQGKSYPNLKVNSKGPLGDELNRILKGERVYKLAMGGKLNNMKGNKNTINLFAKGGKLSSGYGGDFSNGMREINAGGTHEENPNMGIQLGVDQEGIPNLVEQGEILFKDYVFSDRIKLPKDLKKEHKFRGKTFADAAKNAQRESKERPFDPISKKGLEASMGRLMMAQEGIKEEQSQKEDNPNVFAKGGMKQTFTRFAPLVGSASGALSNIFSKPDYSEADRIQNVDTKPAMVGWSPIGNKLSYNPLDRDFYINKMNQQTAATRDNIRNTAGGNRAVAQAGLLASDYNYGQNLGNMARQAEEYNQAQRERVEGFNRQTNMYNTETGLKAGMFNAESMNNSKRLQLSKAGSVAQMRQAIKDSKNASLSANMSSMFQGLGDIGWENEQSNWLNMLARNGVLKMDTNGNYIGNAISPLSRAHKQRKGE